MNQVEILESSSTIALRRCVVSEIIEVFSATRPYIVSLIVYWNEHHVILGLHKTA